MPPPSPPRRPRRPRRLLVAVASLLVAVAAGELALRGLLDTGSYRIWSPRLETVFRPRAGLMPGVEGDSRFRTNRLGLRGDEPDPGAAYRILVLGGSTTECLYLDQDEAWPALVQAGLRERGRGPRVQVFNGGVSGRTTRDHVVQLRHLLPQPPAFDAVVLMCGVNDLALRLARDEAYDPHALEQPGAEDRLLPRAFARLPLGVRTGQAWWRRTALWRFASLVRARLDGGERVQDEAGAIYAVWRAKRAAARGLRAELPDLSSALDEQRRNLRTIAALCAARGVRLVLVTHPAAWGPDLPPATEALLWMGGVGDYQNAAASEYYTPAALARGLAAFNAVLAEVAAAEGLECLDLAGALASTPSLFYDDVHFNEEGARRAAAAVTAHLADLPPFR